VNRIGFEPMTCCLEGKNLQIIKGYQYCKSGCYVFTLNMVLCVC